MSDPTNAPNTYELDGIHEYDVTIPYSRTVNGARQDMHIVVRIPAATENDALFLATNISGHVRDHHTHDGARWREAVADIHATCVDDMPSPAELAAELAHWKRVVAGLAGKLPGLLQLTAAEYEAADPDTIVASRSGESMVFLTAAAFAPPPADLFGQPEPAPAPAGPSGMETPGFDPKIEPVTAADVAGMPANPGGHPDPDVRRVAASTLARANPGQVEILSGGEWRRLDSAIIDQVEGTVQILAAGLAVDPVDSDRWILSRPATVEGYASDLPTAAIVGQELLTAQGWMTVEHAETLGPLSGNAYKASLIGENGAYQTSFNAADALLLRNTRPGWWS